MRTTSAQKTACAVLDACLILACLVVETRAADGSKEFTSPTIDVGVAVSDAASSVKFYTEVIGLTEIKGFQVAAPLGADAGLTDGTHELDVHVLVLGEGPGATKLKLIQFKGGAKGDNAFINSQYGFRYLTIFITDTTAAVARLKKHGIRLLGKTPAPVPKEIGEGIYITTVRDPDGNFVELLGPKK